MIRLAIMSDLHVEKGPYHPPALDADLWILAGDIGWGPEGVQWIAANLHGAPCAYVAGNREHWHWGEGIDPVAELRRASAAVPGLRFLQDEVTEYRFGARRLRILGATLWTDYALEGDAEGVMRVCQDKMPDYRNGRGSDGHILTAAQVRAWNRASVGFLDKALAQPFDGDTIVVTHHCPTASSLKARRPEHWPTTASVTELDGLIAARQPLMWVHGHTHWDCDHAIGRTRIVTRQRGTPENEDFTPLAVEI